MSEQTCPAAAKCGGCQRLTMPYEAQLQEKQRRVEGLIGGFCKVSPIIGMENPYHYRNKVHAAFARDGRGRIVSGNYAPGTHRVVPIRECLLEDERADLVVAVVRNLMEKFHLSPYNEDSGQGLIRHVLVRVGKQTGQVLVTLVIGQPQFPARNAFVNALVKACPFITSVVVNLNGFRTSMILGKSSRVAYGKGFIEDVLCSKRFAISPASFYQINPTQTEKLYGLAVDFAALTGRERLLDAYCGIGTIGLVAADRAAQVIGVELNPDAVRDAEKNARRNGADNAAFYQGDAGDFMRRMAQKGEKLDVVMMDPPRAGSDERFLQALCQLSPQRVVYVSCMPETLARDLRFLTAHGYRAVNAAPVDMFPHTEHVETVCLLVLRNPVTHINIDVDVEEMVQDKRGLATYGQIKDYVLEQNGLKVSSLYIAQVKQKHGIIERDNYNKPKSEDVRQPQCPPDKERAITEALKHFGMI